MLRRIAIALLALGTLGGFGAGLASLAWHHHNGFAGWHNRARFACEQAPAAVAPAAPQVAQPPSVIVIPVVTVPGGAVPAVTVVAAPPAPSAAP